MKQYFNFSAGPAMLPAEVLREAEQELLNWQGTHSSVMEVSHRGEAFMQLARESVTDLRELLAIPDNYHVLFCQGGARGQFSALPMNLLADSTTTMDYLISGFWSQSAANEGKKYCRVNPIELRYQDKDGLLALQEMANWPLSSARYLHYCPNETIEGVAIFSQPDFADKVVLADFSSCLLSTPVDISRYGVIYAGAQKNIGPAGLTIVIVREDLLKQAQPYLPAILDYRLLAQNDSMYNTPPTFAWYLAARVFKWLKKQGGVAQIGKLNQQKAQLLYQAIDSTDFYQNQVAFANRSIMNVPFSLRQPELTPLFIEQAQAHGLSSLKGHKVVGGIRASIYNAMPLAGVQALVDFMQEFAKRQG